VVVALVVWCAWAAPADAATHIWLGPDNGNWSVAGNWSGGVPALGEPDLAIWLATEGESNADIPGLEVESLVLGGGHQVDDGGAGTLGIADGAVIQSGGSDNQLNIDLELANAAKIEVKSTGGTFGLGSVVTGGDEVKFTGGSGAGTDLTGAVFVPKLLVASGNFEGEALASNQIGDATDVTVSGFFALTGGEVIRSLTVDGGRVSIPAVLRTTVGGNTDSQPGVTLAGGRIESTGPLITRGVKATPAAASAEIDTPIWSQLNGVQFIVDVAPGLTQPALKLSRGVKSNQGNTSGGISKQGGGTLLMSGNNDLPGIDVSAGTLVPGSPALNVTNLSFASTGSLHLEAASGTVPQVNATGTVTIDPAARLTGTIPTVPAGTQHTAIANDLADGVTGQFATTGGSVFTTPLGQPYTATYTGGDGNDVVVTAGSVPVAPQAPAAPAASPSTGAVAVADRTKPTLGALTFSASSFRAATSGGSTAQRKKSKKKAPTGTKVGFALSEASSVKFTIQRKTSGRRAKGKCRAATRGNRFKPKCTLWKNVAGSFTVRGKAGKNSFTFRGRVGGRALKPGGYRLNGTATDPSRNASLPKQKAFTIVR